VREAQSLQHGHRGVGIVRQPLECRGGRANVGEGRVARLECEAPDPAECGAFVLLGVVLSDQQADAESVVEADRW